MAVVFAGTGDGWGRKSRNVIPQKTPAAQFLVFSLRYTFGLGCCLVCVRAPFNNAQTHISKSAVMLEVALYHYALMSNCSENVFLTLLNHIHDDMVARTIYAKAIKYNTVPEISDEPMDSLATMVIVIYFKSGLK